MNDQRKTKKQLLEELERERERSLALREVSKRVAAANDTDEILDLIVNEAARLVGAGSAFLWLLEGDELVLSASVGDADGVRYIREAAPRLKVGDGGGMVGYVMATGKPVFGEGAAKILLPETRRALEEIGRDPAATGAVPLLANGRSIGTLSLGDAQNHGRRFTEDEIALLMAFADHAALAMEKARLLNESETERERADSLYRVSNLLAGAHDTDEVLELIVNEAARLVGVDAGFIRLMSNGELVASVATEAAAEFVDGLHTSVEIGEGTTPMGHAMATKKPLVVEDSEEGEFMSPEMASLNRNTVSMEPLPSRSWPMTVPSARSD